MAVLKGYTYILPTASPFEALDEIKIALLLEDMGIVPLHLNDIVDLRLSGRRVRKMAEICPYHRAVKCDPLFNPNCHNEEKRYTLCKFPHVVYLAAFRNKLKVGTAVKGRELLRVYEQGARAFSILAVTRDYPHAVMLERTVSKTYDEIKERPRITYSDVIIHNADEIIRLRDKLNQITKRIALDLGLNDWLKARVLHYPCLDEEMTLLNSSEDFKGRIVGYIGPFLILKRNDYISSVLDLRKVEGMEVRGYVIDGVSGETTEIY